ncbi:MAG: hypothetical protein R3D81_09435 [Thalassovita sp.]|jgi:hypothetical protein|uniref:hypothetical protein n=1 Tax=Thalassovita litoralis TaxID=1010611 RepID=UPI00163D59F4|nr:hypothetical protein [Thalassovita litoralis]
MECWGWHVWHYGDDAGVAYRYTMNLLRLTKDDPQNIADCPYRQGAQECPLSVGKAKE